MEVLLLNNNLTFHKIDTFSNEYIYKHSNNITILMSGSEYIDNRDISLYYSFNDSTYTLLGSYNSLNSFYSIDVSSFDENESVDIYLKAVETIGSTEYTYKASKITRKCLTLSNDVIFKINGENIPDVSYKIDKQLTVSAVDIYGVKNISDIHYKIDNSTTNNTYTPIQNIYVYDNYGYISTLTITVGTKVNINNKLKIYIKVIYEDDSYNEFILCQFDSNNTTDSIVLTIQPVENTEYKFSSVSFAGTYVINAGDEIDLFKYYVYDTNNSLYYIGDVTYDADDNSFTLSYQAGINGPNTFYIKFEITTKGKNVIYINSNKFICLNNYINYSKWSFSVVNTKQILDYQFNRYDNISYVINIEKEGLYSIENIYLRDTYNNKNYLVMNIGISDFYSVTIVDSKIYINIDIRIFNELSLSKIDVTLVIKDTLYSYNIISNRIILKYSYFSIATSKSTIDRNSMFSVDNYNSYVSFFDLVNGFYIINPNNVSLNNTDERCFVTGKLTVPADKLASVANFNMSDIKFNLYTLNKYIEPSQTDSVFDMNIENVNTVVFNTIYKTYYGALNNIVLPANDNNKLADFFYEYGKVSYKQAFNITLDSTETTRSIDISKPHNVTNTIIYFVYKTNNGDTLKVTCNDYNTYFNVVFDYQLSSDMEISLYIIEWIINSENTQSKINDILFISNCKCLYAINGYTYINSINIDIDTAYTCRLISAPTQLAMKRLYNDIVELYSHQFVISYLTTNDTIVMKLKEKFKNRSIMIKPTIDDFRKIMYNITRE